MTTEVKSRPRGESGAAKKLGDGGFTVNDTDVQRKSFALAKINAGRGPIPKYGSAEWVLLPADDPRREAAMAIAAEAWFSEGQPDVIAGRFFTELYAASKAAKVAEDEDYQAAVAAHREYWSKAAARRAGRYPVRRTSNVVPLRPSGGDAA
ncbi:hypothetical protein [Aeromicrobium piscarium]|uniref:DUF2742 domain-containing protein n=1 Tax=Aeromicrobium piscarium TaxID=2590901 RepID=A0A554S8Y8_9ACTN|nr:hypothetical protein [Aeromicrobium piscarium]TSD62809.1 hypothetical protein FNM00_10580 [Aeromicrobium piscarium]